MTDLNDPIYLDAAASAPPRTEAVAAARDAIERFADPCSPHAVARAARSALEDARHAVAEAIGAHSDEIVFTSGGTEANALAVRAGLAAMDAGRGGRMIASASEHSSILAAAASAGLEVLEIPTDGTGRVDVDRWADEIGRPGVAIAAIQHANHLVGTLQPVAECIRLARPHGVPVHVDACQTAATLPIDVVALGMDVLSISSHKAYGPTGAGALFVRRGTPLSPLLAGDDRERRLRAGMPNIPGIAGMAAALAASAGDLSDRAAQLWSQGGRLRAGLAAAGIRVLGHATHRAPHIVTWVAPAIDAETLLMTLEDRGILCSTVPAARVSGGGLSPGDVAVRFGLWPGVTDAQIEHVVATVPPLIRDLGALDYEPAPPRRDLPNDLATRRPTRRRT
jgi:cysteine desulfurase